MADSPVSEQEQALRRRARRRLIGAIALGLVAVVVLPMLFDPEPRPLGGQVSIEIPAHNAPFEPISPPLAPAAETPVPELPAPVSPSLPAKVEPSKPAPPPPVAKPVPAPTPVAPKPAAKPTAPAEVKPAAKPAESKPASSGAQAIYVQIGAFSSLDNARALAERAKAAGFSASVASAGGQHRVRVGPFADLKTALAGQARLKDRGFNSILIQP